MLTARRADVSLCLLKNNVIRLVCLTLLCLSILAANAPEVKAGSVSVDPNFVAAINPPGAVYSVTVQPDGKILVGGRFSYAGGQEGKGFVRLNSDGSLDTSFNFGMYGLVVASAVQADGRILIGGNDFSNEPGGRGVGFMRLNPDGSLDNSFRLPSFFPTTAEVSTIVVQPDRKIFIGGNFIVEGTVTQAYIARLNPDGSVDPSFKARAHVPVSAILLQPDGKIVAGGMFSNEAGERRPLIARLNSDGSLDTTFGDGYPNSVISGAVLAIVKRPDAGYVIGGQFRVTDFPVFAVENIATVSDDGRIFFYRLPSGLPGTVYALAPQPDSNVIAGGSFRWDIPGLFLPNYLVRTSPPFGPDHTFAPQPNDVVRALATQPDGKILVGGGFTSIGGQPRFGLARLLATAPLSLTSSLNASTPGERVTFTATLRLPPSTPTPPTGVVTFKEGNTVLASVPLDASGRAFFSTSSLSSGRHVITASYSGDQNFNPAEGILEQNVIARAIRFAASDYTVNEGIGEINLTVLRSGDISGSETVSLVTYDGTASARSDYTSASSTMTFAPGETSKTITIFITDDALVEGDESFRVNLVESTFTGVITLPSIVIVTIDDNDTSSSAPNPIDEAEFFVRQHYRDFLSREPDTEGLQFWMRQITECEERPDAEREECREVRRINVSAAFFLSAEFQETGFFFIRTMRAAYGDRSDKVSHVFLNGFLNASRQLDEGVIVGADGWQERLKANRQAFLLRVVNAPTFVTSFPTTMTATEYVDALYRTAEVVPAAEERQAAIAAFSAGGDEGRAAALGVVADSESVRRAELNPAFVLMEYFGYMRRNPTDAPDTNNDGYQFWLRKLNAFGGDFLRAEMVKAFITSGEYRSRFGQP